MKEEPAAEWKQAEYAKDDASAQTDNTKDEAVNKAKKAADAEPEQPKQSRFQKMEQGLGEKYPRAAKGWAYFKEVWEETFPDPDKARRERMEKRRKAAKDQREHEERLAAMTPEEIEELEKSIPEWKRQALVVSGSGDAEPEKKSYFGQLKDRVSQTEAAKKFRESEDFEKLTAMRDNYRQFRSNLSEGVETSQSPIVQAGATVADMATQETGCARAISMMEAYDPDFDLNELEIEAAEVFKEFYTNFLAGNLEYLETVSGGVALGLCKAECKRRATEGWRYRYEDLLHCSDATFQLGEISQNNNAPSFQYIVTTQEINCKVSLKDPEEVTEGADDDIMQYQWRFTISRHEEPDIERSGHYWEVTELQKVGELKQLV